MPDQPASTNVLDRALAALAATDPGLAGEARRELDEIRRGRKFGLVFNRHLPESVRLLTHPIKRGVKVALRTPAAAGPDKQTRALKDATWFVTRVERIDGERVAHLAPASDQAPETEPRLVSELVVVREFGEAVYPGLTPIERIERGKPDDPAHLVINGENYHALQALRFTHRAKVDLIYIDPPYNTGNQGWIYNDKYVDTSAGDASSKWLSFMERRLSIARDLLKDTGVVIVAIGDDEHHRLRMLMDQIFGAQHFLANLVWQGNSKSDARFGGGGVDYMLVFAKSVDDLLIADARWLEKKPGVDEIQKVAAEFWKKSGHDAARASEMLKNWWRNVPNDSPWRANKEYKNIDGQGRVFLAGPIDSPNYRANLCYEVLHPVTGNPVPTPKNGWRVSREKMTELIAADEVLFKESDTLLPSRKFFLNRVDSRVPEVVFRVDRRTASRRLTKVLGEDRFPYPKDHEVLARWINIATSRKSDAVVLDFFGGSGSTAEAVMRLNAEDGGTRQAILVTNNELAAADAKRLTKAGYAPGDPEWEARGVFEYVTRPRISTVVTGVRPDGSTYSEGLDANVEFFEMTYLDESRVSRDREFEAIAPLLWMRAGGVGRRVVVEDERGWVLPEDATYGVLFTDDATGPFLKALAARLKSDAPAPSHVFVVTDSDSHFEHVSGRLPGGVEAVRLYESYLRNFEINVEITS